jgi:hypothetical protein
MSVVAMEVALTNGLFALYFLVLFFDSGVLVSVPIL